MNYDQAIAIYSGFRDTQLTELKSDLIEAAVRYARVRVDWLLTDAETRRSMEAGRTSSHNAFIIACDILSRNMEKKGESGAWRVQLGQDRKEIGDFACFMHCLLGISAR